MKRLRQLFGRRLWLSVPMICTVMQVSASVSGFSQTVTLHMGRTELREVFRQLREQTGHIFTFSDSRVDGQTTLGDVNLDGATLEQALDAVLDGTAYTWTADDRRVMIIPNNQAPQQPAQRQLMNVSGTVRSSGGVLLPSVSVQIKGTGTNTTTDAAGAYDMRVARGATLVFSHVGLATREIVVGAQTRIDVTMQEAVTQTDHAVVTGIFERRKEGFTGSATTVTREDILRLSPSNALKALSMIDPSFTMGNSNISGSNPGAVPDFQLRGSQNMGSYQQYDAEYLRGDAVTRPNQPLFVLDGIIGVGSTAIMDLDPEQIESITLLKDAAATVIYGSDAANGVVVVETRKPIAGKLRVSYNGNYGITWPDLGAYDLTNAAEKLEIEKLAGYPNTAAGTDDPTAVLNYYNEIEKEVLRGVNTDWLSIPVRAAFTHRHGFNLEGGDQALRYKVYLGANFAPGVMRNTGLNSQSGRVDLHYRNGKWQIINQTLLDHSVTDRSSNYGSFSQYALMNPYYTPYDGNGQIKRVLDPQAFQLGNYGMPTLNPLYNTLYDMRDQYAELKVQENLRAQWQPIEELRLDAGFVLTKSRGTGERFKPSHHNDFASIINPAQKGRFTQDRRDIDNWNVYLTASFNKLLNEKHLFSAFARFNIDERSNYLSTLSMVGFPNDKLSEIFMGSTYEDVSGDESMSRSVGGVFTGNYIFDQRYAADFSVRADASSQFGRENRMAPFWSGGVKWSAHNEKFLSNVQWLDELILRGTIGTTGSQDFSPWQALQTYSYNGTMSVYPSSDVVGATLLALGNPNLKWQQTIEKNAAIDLTLWDGRFGARFELYDKLTRNALLDFTLPPSVGFETIKENLGEISNRGYEMEARIMPWRNVDKRAYWMIILNGAHNVSKIEKLSDAMKALNDQVYSGNDATKPLPQYVSGMSTTALWGVQSGGIDPQTGEEILIKRDGTLTTEWDVADRVVIGDRRPDLAGNISTTFAYGDFSFTLGGGYTFGGQIYNQTLADRVENANLRLNVDRRVLTERWRNPGDEVKFKSIEGDTGRERTKATSRFVMRNNEFRLSSMNFSWRMSAENYAFLQKAGFKSAQVSLYCEDIARFSTVRMERGISYPFARSVSMSVNFAF